jgi:hypothetical protein
MVSLARAATMMYRTANSAAGLLWSIAVHPFSLKQIIAAYQNTSAANCLLQ